MVHSCTARAYTFFAEHVISISVTIFAFGICAIGMFTYNLSPLWLPALAVGETFVHWTRGRIFRKRFPDKPIPKIIDVPTKTLLSRVTKAACFHFCCPVKLTRAITIVTLMTVFVHGTMQYAMAAAKTRIVQWHRSVQTKSLEDHLIPPLAKLVSEYAEQPIVLPDSLNGFPILNKRLGKRTRRSAKALEVIV